MAKSVDLLLIVPSLPNSYGMIEKAHVPEYNLGVGYIASYLKRHGQEVEIVDMTVRGGSLDDLVAQAAAWGPRIVGFTVVTSLYVTVKAVLERLRRLLPETVFVCGGPHPTVLYEECLTDAGFDYVAVGEGEKTCLGLVEALKSGGDPRAVPGLAFLGEDGRVRLTGPAERVELDELPYPLREREMAYLYKNQVYFNDPKAPSYNLLTTRGCPYHCTFCGASTVFPGKMRRRSAENVFAEMRQAHEALGIRYFFFEDSTFVFLERLVRDLCQMIIDSGIDLRWGAMGRLNHVRPDLYKLMKTAGCAFLFFGVESGDNEILRRIRKNFTIEEAFENLRIVKQIGISSNCSFIIGLPGDTRETIEKTIATALEMDPDYVSFSLATPYPGTEMWDQCLSDGWTPPPWKAYEKSRYQEPIYVPSGLTAEQLQTYLRMAYRRFYYRPSYILRHLLRLKSPAMFRHHLGVALSLAKSSFFRKPPVQG